VTSTTTDGDAGTLSRAHRLALACIAGLLLVQYAWHATGSGGSVLAASVYALPLLWLALLVAARRRGAWFWAGVLALPYLCHGVAEAWASTTQRLPALAEATLATLLAVAVSWDGLRARRAARRAAPPPAGADAEAGPEDRGDANV
jgi:uncharacterized membrane protein